MHRTGTSAVARVVNLLGADIASDLISPKPDNIRGFWESASIVQIRDQLLRDLGSSSADPLPLPHGWIKAPSARRAQERLTDLVQCQFQGSSLFVVKDPRISKLLPQWTKLLAEIDVEIVVVLTVCNPLEVAASLQKRDQMSFASSLLLVLFEVRKGEPRSTTVFREVRANPRQLARPGMQASVDPGVPVGLCRSFGAGLTILRRLVWPEADQFSRGHTSDV